MKAFKTLELNEAVALIRDKDVWSVLKPADAMAVEQFGLFSFHFENGVDNSGFVGWLATRLKQQLGTGVFVVCGQNTSRGGIFDYWGVPVAMTQQAKDVINQIKAI